MYFGDLAILLEVDDFNRDEVQTLIPQFDVSEGLQVHHNLVDSSE